MLRRYRTTSAAASDLKSEHKAARSRSHCGSGCIFVKDLGTLPGERTFRRDTKEKMEKIPMTEGGFNRLEAELKQLRTHDRPAVIRRLRKRGSMAICRRTRNTTRPVSARASSKAGSPSWRISLAGEVIDPTKLTGDKVTGTTVTLADEETDEEATYTLVGPDESDIKQGLVSITAPLARAIIGKAVGDSVEVPAPGGARGYEIVSIEIR